MRAAQAVALDQQTEKAVLEHGRRLLESFHSAYEQVPVGREPEFRRGEFACWRQLLGTIYGNTVAQDLTEKVSESTRLTIPHCGPLADDGRPILVGILAAICSLGSYRNNEALN